MQHVWPKRALVNFNIKITATILYNKGCPVRIYPNTHQNELYKIYCIFIFFKNLKIKNNFLNF